MRFIVPFSYLFCIFAVEMKVFDKIKVWSIRICQLPYLKYVLVILGGILVVGFLDENSLWSHMKYRQRIQELTEERDRYDADFKRSQAQIKELNRNPKAMEKIARERYFMKTQDEDIFVLSDDDRAPKPIVANETVE